MDDTHVKISTETCDRYRAFGGETFDSSTVDSFEPGRFWRRAEAGKEWFDSLSPDDRRRMRDEDASIDGLFKGL